MEIRQGFNVEGDTSLAAAVDFANDHGFDFVEVNMDQGFARSTVDPEAVRDRVADAGLDLVVHLPYRLDPASPHEEVRLGACRELEAAIDAATAMGADRGVYHAATNVRYDVWPDETIADALRQTVKRLADYASDRGFSACVENIKGPFFDAGDFSWLLTETECSLCLDTGHAYATGHDEQWQAEFLRNHGNRVAHVHLNDTRRPDTDEHLPVGVGMLDFEPLVAAMRETDWTGTCTHEVYAPELGPQRVGKPVFDALLA